MTTQDFPVEVPDGEHGSAKITTFKISRDVAALSNMRLLRDGEYWMRIEEGEYKRLVINGTLMMSNTPMERISNGWIIKWGQGRILINGLGLGCVLTALLKKPEVTEIWVVENNRDVIKLVWPTFKDDPRVKLIEADAMTYKPPKGEMFDYVWHDIWPDINTDNLKDMAVLHRRYARRCKHQNSWTKEYLMRKRRREQRSRYW